VRRWTRSSEDSTVERFKLHKSNAGFQGEWAGSGKTLPVKLEKMSATSIKNPYDGYPAVDTMRNNEPFDYLKTSFLVLKRDSMRVYQARNVQWLSFEQSNVSMIEITSGYDSTALQKINHKLIDVMIQEARNELSCTGPDGELGDYQESVQGFFFGKNVLSVSVFVNFTCDGPHPDFGTESYNFNGHTGDELELTDITTFGDPALAVHNGTRDYDYYEELGERMVTILERLYPKEMNGNDTTDHEDDGCDYSTPDQWAYASWSFSDRGIMLSPSIAHVSAPCRDPDWPLLPYRYLNKHRNPKLKIKIP
ncbi:MAG: hypothetical protein Q8919_06815, partial [Bacteroidota bacterium]|nr:hypothetical protein [Bacteroidota bacterium]